MMIKKAYTNLPSARCMSLNLSCFFPLLFIFILLIPSVQVLAQDEYNEISVFIEVRQIGGSEVSAIIKGNEIFLSVTELFDFPSAGQKGRSDTRIKFII
jgi:hypothetical protein